MKVLNTTRGNITIRELENNRNFKKGDITFLTVGFGFVIEEVLEDEQGLYCMDAGNKRHIYKSNYDEWDYSLIAEKHFRKIEIISDLRK